MNDDSVATGKEITYAIEEVMKYSSVIMKSLCDRRRDNWRASSLLVGAFVFFSISFVGYILLTRVASPDSPVLAWLLPELGLAALSSIAGFVAGMGMFKIQKRRGKVDKITMVQKMLDDVNKKEQVVLENILQIVGEIMKLIPLVKRNYDADALIYGILGSFFGYILSLNMWISLLLGLLIGTYFKLKGERISDKESLRFEELFRRFKQQSEESLNRL